MKHLLQVFLILIIPLTVIGYDWPVTSGPLTATFGELRGDHFHDGIDIGGGRQPVYPVEDGEVVFYYEEGRDPNDIPTGFGTFVLVEHPLNFRSLYSHLETLDVFTGKVSPEIPLGIMGDTGYSLGVHLHLTLVDRELERKVNPLLLLPPRPDPREPVIRAVYLTDDSGKIRLPAQAGVNPANYLLSAEIYDPSHETSYFCPTAPYEIFVLVNGRERFRIKYEALEETEGNEYLKPGNRVISSSYYIGNGWEINLGNVTVNRGQTFIEIVVADAAGNDVRETYTVRAGAGDGETR
jgi:hypothetical protein